MGWIKDIVSPQTRKWEEFYRNRFQHDRVVRSTHGVNCTGGCSWSIHVKDGIVAWETQALDYPLLENSLPPYEPRGVVPVPEVVQSLLQPGAYPAGERPARVKLVETHISWLFFTGAFVYKVKRPVDFGFLDFTTLEKRRFFCLEEIRLNQRLSPDVYLDVVAIAGEGARLTVGGTGPVVEYAVKMRQLPGDRWLSGLLTRGEASPALMRRIAQRIAAFHAAAAEPAGRIGGIDTVRMNTQENFTQTREYVGVTVTAEGYDRVQAYTETFLDVRAGRFAQREQEGRIRDCHGNLHADQICADNGIAFIDCIEFNERFRYSDVAADIAFPAMDVDSYGRPDLSTELVREYVAASGDRGVLDVLDFYKCYRAFTRGKVRGFRLRQLDLGEIERRAVVDRASRYFELAQEYARLPGPLAVAICGLMGTGKTSLGAALAPRLGADVLSSDVLRKELAGIRPEEPHHEAWGEGIYGEVFHRRTYEELHQRAAERLRAGKVVILDASYRQAAWRARAREMARAARSPFLLVETRCPDDLVRRRLAARGAGPSDGRLDLLEAQRDRFEPPLEIAGADRMVVDTSGVSGDVVKGALREIYRRRLAEARSPDKR
jgi:aminoglycoside phosphotransferase family enzyme/predicted kinase